MLIGKGRTLLLVEDDQAVRKLISGVLEANGYLVLAAVDGETAVAAAKAHPGEIHLIITDFGLGETNGLQVASRIAAIRPGIGVLLISGYSEIPVPLDLQDSFRAEFLAKPFSMETMLAKVRSMIALGNGGGADPAATVPGP